MIETPQNPDGELQKRAEVFVKEYGDLVEKHKIDFVNFPMFVPDGQGGFRIVIQNQPVDTTGQPVKSPFMVKE